MFILSDQRDTEGPEAFSRYNEYLAENRNRFPESAYALATSDWYYSFTHHQAPHDASLVSAQIREPAAGDRQDRSTVSSILIRLASAWHDGFIEFHYPAVFAYRLAAVTPGQGHGEWRYDEFRVTEKDRLIHEIEWAAIENGKTWLIVASDVEHKWIPRKR